MRLNRRTFLRSAGAIMAGGCLAGFGGYQYSTRFEPSWLVVEQVQVPIKNLHAGLEGFKIVQLSDIHLHPFTDIKFVQEAVDKANSLQPDLITLTGDYVYAGAESIFELAPVLGSLNARYGLFSVLGNHDLWTDAAVVQAGFERERLPVLRNQGVALEIGHATIYLAGLDDIWSGQPDLGAALAGTPPNVPTILLAHEPDFADLSARDGRVSLQLSGHSHGGQVRLPGIGAPVLPYLGQKYDQGLYRVNEMWLYTNRGVGVIPPPVRFNCPPEITEITLVGV
jgi:predicted MPP superfamily phosphohydrolase